MPLRPGTSFGPYEVTGHLGSGGMGDVYRARDSRVGRDVAIKFAAERFSDRFEREARAIAALNHPNISTLYDVGPDYLVMELIDGESPRGPMSLDEAVRIMRQIAQALEYAHERGVIHRDLKPGNIKITPEGSVKVLDFGLAKIGSTAESPESLQDSPTLSMAATQAGVILGTAAYMAPEQARGKPTDKRVDIWAFGVVFYELLTGQPLFKGEDTSEILAAVIKEEPRWESVPVEVRRLLRRCLEKDPRKRLRDIGDVWELLDQPSTGAVPVDGPRMKWLWPGIVLLMALVAGVAGWTTWHAPVPEQQQVRFEIYPPEKTTFAAQVDDPPAVSPDGKRIAFPAVGQDGRKRLWIRDLDSLEARPLPGTEEGFFAFWSPDGRWLAYLSSGGLGLNKIAVSGGPPQSLCVCEVILKGAWSKEGFIIFGSSKGMMKIPEDGGTPTPVTLTNPSRGESVHLVPSLLPDGKHFLYFRFSSMSEYFGTYVASLDAKPEQQPTDRVLDVMGAQFGSGHVLFARAGELMAQAFDVGRLKPMGQAVTLNRTAQTLAPKPGDHVIASGGVGSLSQLTWFDPTGKESGVIGRPGVIAGPRISPDKPIALFTRFDTGPGDLWLYELPRGEHQFSFNELDISPIWSPDSSRLAFISLKSGGSGIALKAVNGIGAEELIATTGTLATLDDWSRDNKYLLLTELDPKTKMDVWVLPLGGDKKAFPYLNQDSNEAEPRLSPNGRWIAYESDKLNGRFDVYVDSFTGKPAGTTTALSGSWKVSTNGGTRPVWSRDGSKLFFISADRKMMGVDVVGTNEAEFKFLPPKELFDVRISGSPWDTFDVGSDGRFLMAIPAQQGLSVPISVTVNWIEALKK